MYPKPFNIFGNRISLEEYYRNLVRRQASSGYNDSLLKKDPNIFRFCSYNVKYFNFKKDANEVISKFIKTYHLNAFSLIEYHKLEDSHINNYGDSTLFEQLKYYGISTHFNLNNYYANQSMVCYTQHIEDLEDISTYLSNEKRGFTHLQINIYTRTLNIITIHLDVLDESGHTRFHEIQKIYDYITSLNLSNVIIIGDFNEWDIHHDEPLYEPVLMEFQDRTGLEDFSTRVHDFLKSKNFINVFHLLEKYPQFSCWSGKLVDFCYKYETTWNHSLKIKNIDFLYVDYSDHLPIILDIEI